MPPHARTLLFAALATVAAPLAVLTPAAAAAAEGELALEDSARGQRAVDALGEQLDGAAAVNGLTTQAMRELLLTDATAWVDVTGRVFFKEPIPTGVADDAPLPTVERAPGDAFALHSKPGSQRVIFLDFDGSLVSGTGWNVSEGVTAGMHPAWTLDGDAATFNTAERDAIASIWARVAEDYAPFDVDVTTQDPGAAAIDRTSPADTAFGTRVLISPSTDASTAICDNQCGGVAYLDVFDVAASHAYYQPAWVFPQALSNSAKSIAEGASHEAGHNFGLSHDGGATSGYYSGHAMWAPIMGVGYSRPVVQWSQGEYAGATTTQDDLAIIAANGAPLRADEAGGTLAAAATALPLGDAYITTRTDQDVYALGSCTGPLSLAATPAPTSPNLDIQLALLDASGAVVTAADPVSVASTTDVANGLAASLTPTVTTATYFLRVDGVGNGTANTGYTDYASIGAYRLNLAGACDATPPAPDTAPSAPQGLTATVRAADLEADVDWAPPASDGGDAVVGYEVTLDGEVVADLGADQTAVTLVDLDEGESYALAVRALNGVGLSEAAQTSFSVPAAPSEDPAATAPTAPRIGAAKSGARGGKSTAAATWSPPSTDGGARVTGYQVVAQRLNSSGAVVGVVTSRWLGASARSVTLKLTKGRYRFVVVASNAVGVSPTSAPSKVVRAR